jgi:tetratricopeptide (TPR) repeat protein
MRVREWAVDRTDNRDAQQQTRTGRDAHFGVLDLTVVRQFALAAEDSSAVAASKHVVAGDIPAQLPGFQPRPSLLAQLNQVGEGQAVAHVMTGMAGVGKTQLAAAYARAKVAAGWRLVAWVNAESSESLRAGLAAVADAAGLSDGGSRLGTADAGLAVRHWLEADGDRCLLVFDDARDPDVLRPFVPTSGAARVLITGAQESVAGLGASVPVDVFSAEEALALLDGRTGLADDAGASALAAELGYLPLAVDHAAAVIAGQRVGYETYLEWLRALPLKEQLTRVEGQTYPPGVAEAVLLSLDAVWAVDQGGVCTSVMEVMAVLSEAGVRRELLHAAGQAGVLAGSGRRAKVAADLVDRALAWLVERSLLTFNLDGQTVIAHRLVTRVVRDGLARRGRLTGVCRRAASSLEAYAEALAGQQDHAAVRDFPWQVTALLNNANGPAGGTDQELARILLRLRFLALYHLIELGDSMSQAIAVGEPLTADLERAQGHGHPDTLNARNSLAAAYHATGRAAEAVPLFEQILVGRERLLGPDHPDTLTSQNNLAAAYRDAGRIAEAILLFRLTLAARERLLGANHPSTVNSRGNLAAAYRDTGRIAEAIPLFEQTLAERERLLGRDHLDTLRSRGNLANAYWQAGRVAEAIPLVEQTLATHERLLGADHPSTLASRNNLASAYREAGRVAEAISLHEQTLAACERLLGADHPSTLASRSNLAAAYQAAGRIAEAISQFEQVFATRQRLLGADDPETLTARDHLALAYQDAGRTARPITAERGSDEQG